MFEILLGVALITLASKVGPAWARRIEGQGTDPEVVRRLGEAEERLTQSACCSNSGRGRGWGQGNRLREAGSGKREAGKGKRERGRVTTALRAPRLIHT
jgi:hypothetical protein